MHIVRGERCSSASVVNRNCVENGSVLRVFLWPRKPAIGETSPAPFSVTRMKSLPTEVAMKIGVQVFCFPCEG